MISFPPIRGLILDLDGLLIDSERWNWEAHNDVLACIGVEALALSEMRTLAGLSDEAEAAQIGRLRPQTATDHAAYVDAVRQTYQQIRDRSLAPLPGVHHLLRVAHVLHLRIALASNSSLPSIDAVLHGLGIHSAFNAIACGAEVAHGKPAPDSYLLALHRLDLEPEEALAVEDSATGLQAACAAGLRCAVVPGVLTALHDFSTACARFGTLNELAGRLPEYAVTWPARETAAPRKVQTVAREGVA